MKKAILLSFITFLTAISIAFASKPIVKIQFSNVYNYLTEVAYVENNGVLDGRVMPYLMSEETPIDHKVAIINALLMNNKIKNNAMTYKQFMARKYGENFQTMDLNNLAASELLCLGYLTLMDEAGKTDNALPILEMAKSKDPASKTIATIHALVVAQNSMNAGNECAAWKIFESVQKDASLNSDLNDAITVALTNGMTDIKAACN